MLWELVFMLVILKIPVVYLCAVVYYAIKAEPEPEPEHGEGGTSTEVPPSPWKPWRNWGRPGSRPRRGGPHGSPRRGYARPARAACAQAKVQQR